MGFVARGMKGHISSKPTIATVYGLRGNFEAGMAFYRGHKFPKETSTKIREIQHTTATTLLGRSSNLSALALTKLEF